ncbi:MAG: DUF3857 domain-containing protein [Bacteroidota bacterium]
MRSVLNLFLLLLLSVTPLFSQKKELKTKFGKISDAEIAMKSYEPDPAAPGVVLFDKGVVSHRYVDHKGFMQEYKRHVRLKIFKKEAYDLADVIIFYFKKQKIVDLKASCYNIENGKLVETELQKSNIFDESLTRARLLKKFSIPAVREGSIIEYTYTISDDFVVELPDWNFQQEEIPTIWSEFEAEIPSFIEYSKVAQGWYPFSLAVDENGNAAISLTTAERSGGSITNTSMGSANVEYQVKKLHFIQENIPALKPESFVASTSDYLSRIYFDVHAVYDTDLIPSGTSYQLVNGAFRELNNTWEKLGEEMLEDSYEDALKSSKYTADIAAQTVVGKSTLLEKTTALYEYVGKNFQVRHLPYPWLSQSFEKLNKDRNGTETDVNLLFINLLRKVKINAWPVMISTRAHGHIHPVRIDPSEMDRVITAVELEDQSLLLLDASAFPNPIGLLDDEDLNENGLLIKAKGDIKWVPLQNKVSVKTIYLATLNLKPEGALSGKVVCAQTGYEAVKSRAVLHKDRDTLNFVRTTFKEWAADGAFSEIKIENGNQWQEPTVKTEFKLESSAFSSVSGNKIFVTPSLGLGLHENPFKNPTRKFNVDLGTPHDENYNIIINIPAGYTVEEKPKGAKMAFGENALVFEYLVESTPDQIKIIIRNKYKKPYIGADLYPELREYFSTLVAKMEEQIVFTKS